MSIADRFNDCLERIIQYNQEHGASFMSNSAAYCKAPAFEEIVSMGYEALPHIRKAYVTLRTYEPIFNAEEFELLSEENKQKVLKQSSEDFSQRVMEECSVVSFVLPTLVHRIIGEDYKVPEEMHGRISDIQRFTRQWLHLNMHKYIL